MLFSYILASLHTFDVSLILYCYFCVGGCEFFLTGNTVYVTSTPEKQDWKGVLCTAHVSSKGVLYATFDG
jgi:hypothetical protein